MSAPTRETRRRLLLGLLTAVALCSVAAAIALVVRPPGDNAPPVPTHQRPPLLPAGGGPAPMTITAADGRTITCPTGSAPTVAISEATFTPALTGGTTMKRGRYRIRLRGTVDNETGSTVDVRRLTASVRGRFWPGARVTVRPTIAAQSSVPIVVDGVYDSDERGPVRVGTHFDWSWHGAELADCGENGLVEDD
jgi:hypothetical protein